MKSLKDMAKSLQVVVEFMDGREKGNLKDLMGQTVTIIDFGMLKDEKTAKPYVVFITKEDPKNFYFGGQVLTDDLQELEENGYKEEIQKEGLPTLFGEKKSKNGLTYSTNTFYPEA